jgi:hypothetical protein
MDLSTQLQQKISYKAELKQIGVHLLELELMNVQQTQQVSEKTNKT